MFRHFLLLSLLSANALAQPANPPLLSYATYLGIPLGAFAVDSAGYIYTGAIYPDGIGPDGPRPVGCSALTKLNQTGTAVVWSVCVPISYIYVVAVDASGYIYVSGGASQNMYPSTIIKLSSDARQTIYSTSLAGTLVSNFVLDGGGNLYMTGGANAAFQPSPGAFLAKGGATFAAKLNPTGQVQYATYLDLVGSYDIAVDGKGQAWVVGATCPVGVAGCGGPGQAGSGSGIRKLDANGASLLVTKTFGGMGGADQGYAYNDAAVGVAVDPVDSAWVVGFDESGGVPTTPGSPAPTRPFPAFPPGGDLGFAVKWSPSGDLLYGTYLGNNDSGEYVESVTIDGQGNPYFALNRDTYSATPNATVMALSADGATLLFSAALHSPVQWISLDGKGGLYTAGNTTTLDFLATPGAYQPFYPSELFPGYAAKFDLTTRASSQFLAVVNAANFMPGGNRDYPNGAVAPGEIVTLFGTGFPVNPKLTFDGRPAAILYASATQINTVVPFEVSAPGTAVSVEGAQAYELPVWPAVPGLFTADGSGQGQLAALNQDETPNSSSNPAKVGSVVAVYLTGAGAMTPPIADGQFGPLTPPFPGLVLGVSASVNGMGAPVLFAGQAPGLIAGAIQVNVQIPIGTVSGNAYLVVYVGNYQTVAFAGTTIAVQ